MMHPNEPPKRSSTCNRCRARKVKCNGREPCDRCLPLHAAACVYAPSRRGRRQPKPGQQPTVEKRLAKMEAWMQAQTDPASTARTVLPYEPSHASGVLTTSPETQLAPPRTCRELTLPPFDTLMPDNASMAGRDPHPRHDADPAISPSLSFDTEPLHPSSFGIPTAHARNLLQPGEALTSMSADVDEDEDSHHSAAGDKEGGMLTPQIENWEFHGPGSWLAICSKPGLAWIAQRTGENDFGESARDMLTSWTRRLSMDNSMFNLGDGAEPDHETAWHYVNAYFDESLEAVYGVVHRPEFESSLVSYFRGELSRNGDATWHALRKTVYAAGCRIYLAKNSSMSFLDIQRQAWAYFQDALSSLVRIMFTPSGLLSVRTLLAMAFFAGGLGIPSLEYMLCATAARKAQAKGLHRQPAQGWNLPENDVKHRNWLFWAVYCCEKHIAQRSGRPSVIDDDEISCQIPKDICPGSTIDMPAFVAIIKLARIASQVSRRLLSVKGFRQSTVTLFQTVRELDDDLRLWKLSLPADLRPQDQLRRFTNTETTPILIHYAYYGTLLYIHSIFATPWISSTLFGHDRGSAMQDQILASSDMVHVAARNLLVMCKSIELKADASQWGGFYFPMLGVINVLIHVLKYPTAPSTSSDVALLDVAAGYFANMEFVTAGEFTFPFVRDVAALGRRTVQKFADAEKSMADAAKDVDRDVPFAHPDMEFADENYLFPSMETFDLEEWGIFASVFDEEAVAG